MELVMSNLFNRLWQRVLSWFPRKPRTITPAAPASPPSTSEHSNTNRPGDWLLERQDAGLPTPLDEQPTAAPTGKTGLHIMGEIDLGDYGRVIKRESDEWFKKAKANGTPAAPAKPRKPRVAKKLLDTTAPIAPLVDVATQIKKPTNTEELEAALALLNQTPEWRSGKYHSDGQPYVPGEGPWLTHETYHPGLFPHNEDSGIFHFRGHLLEQLDQYFEAIARMRTGDPGAYDLYSKIGGSISPHSSLGELDELPAIWHDPKTRPAFGCVSLCGIAREEKPDDTNLIRMTYFQKLKKPSPLVEPAHGDVYQVNTYYDEWDKRSGPAGKWLHKRGWFKKHGFVTTYHVEIVGQDRVRVLKELQTKSTRIVRRKKHLANQRPRLTSHQKEIDYAEYQEWDYPKSLGQGDIFVGKKPSAEEIARHGRMGFYWRANAAIRSEFAVRVTVINKAGNRAVFTVNPERFGYFFRDRDAVLDNRGRKLRIFHVVRPHTRTLPNGNTITLRMSFRGIREFNWGPYSVHITVPGLHHMPITEYTLGAVDAEYLPKGGISMEGIGVALQKHIDGEPVQKAFRGIEKKYHVDFRPDRNP